MAKGTNQKAKLLYLAKILYQQSDERHPLTVQQLITKLAQYGIDAERKSIYSDIEALEQFGLDIITVKGRSNHYYVGQRLFQLAELKMLVDAAQSAKFITARKSEQLIQKISSLASRHEALFLRRQVYVQGRVKTMNESIYYIVDDIQAAMAENSEIVFTYHDWVVKPAAPKHLQRRWRKEREGYRVSPWALVWQGENYYLVAYEETSGILKHFRVDKIGSIRLLNLPRKGKSTFEGLDMGEYTKYTFSMFSGKKTKVTMKFHNSLAGVVVDRFGKDVFIVPEGPDNFIISEEVAISPQFLSWIFGFGAQAAVLSPDHVVRQVVETALQVLDSHKETAQQE